jgi:hypothetical protein
VLGAVVAEMRFYSLQKHQEKSQNSHNKTETQYENAFSKPPKQPIPRKTAKIFGKMGRRGFPRRAPPHASSGGGGENNRTLNPL